MSKHLQRLAERAMGRSGPLRAQTAPRAPDTDSAAQTDQAPMALAQQSNRPQAAPSAGEAPHSSAPLRTHPAKDLEVETLRNSQFPLRRAAEATPHGPHAPPRLLNAPLQPIPAAIPQRTMPTTEQAHAPAGQANEDRPEGYELLVPAPLLPHHEHRDDDLTQRAALRPISAPSAARQAVPAVEETTEVHVTIGRIEVTAVQTTPAQKPPPRRRQAPLSLDEYIARRQEGRT